MLLTSNQDQRTVDILRASQCGFEGRYPKVCCSLSTVSSSTTTTTTTARTTTDPDVIQRTTKTASQRAGPEEDYSVCGKVSITADRIVDGKPAELGTFLASGFTFKKKNNNKLGFYSFPFVQLFQDYYEWE